jgi:hypothetical protein
VGDQFFLLRGKQTRKFYLNQISKLLQWKMGKEVTDLHVTQLMGAHGFLSLDFFKKT